MERYVEAGLVDGDKVFKINFPTLDELTEEDRENWRKGDKDEEGAQPGRAGEAGYREGPA